MHNSTRVVVAILTVAAMLPLNAQDKPADLPTFRSTTRLVQVNVVVQGKGRQPVTDLKKTDFIVTEKGKPQAVSFFGMVRSDGGTGSRKPAPKLPQNLFSNRFGDRSDVPPNVTVILLDSLNTSWQDQHYGREGVMKFLKQIKPEDRVALYSLGQGLRILHDYTSDASALVERLNKWTGQNLPQLEASTVNMDDPLISALADQPGALEGEIRMANFMTRNRVVNTLHALESIAEHLASVPGRKSLIWVSGGFPLMIGFDDMGTADSSGASAAMQDRETFFDEIERTLRALNHADVAVYPVDARGLMTDPMFSAQTRGAPRPGARSFTPKNLDTMETLADRTGGKAYYNRNDLDGAIREVFNDTSVTYTLGYYSANPETDGKFREIKVKVNRPGLNVRYRKGYFAFADMKANDEKAIKSEIANAVWSPLDATAVAVNARVDRMKDGNVVSIYVQIDPTSTTLNQDGDRWKGRLDLAFVFKDQEAKQLGGSGDTVEMNLSKENYMKSLKQGIVYHRALAVPPKARSLRIVVRDAPSGMSGSLTVPMSQVALYVPPVKPATPAATPPAPPAPEK